MNYVGSVNKRTFEVKLGAITKGIDWMAIPEGTTDITKNEFGLMYCWDTANNLIFYNGKWVQWGDGTGLNDFDDYCKSNGDSVKVVSVTDMLEAMKEFMGSKPIELEELNSNLNDVEIKPVKSDGGSSSYYFSKLPKSVIDEIVKTGGIEVKDIVRYCFDNDADCKDIIKALKRIRENLKGGGKEGVDAQYDLNKIKFFVNELDQYLQVILGGEVN